MSVIQYNVQNIQSNIIHAQYTKNSTQYNNTQYNET